MNTQPIFWHRQRGGVSPRPVTDSTDVRASSGTGASPSGGDRCDFQRPSGSRSQPSSPAGYSLRSTAPSAARSSPTSPVLTHPRSADWRCSSTPPRGACRATAAKHAARTVMLIGTIALHWCRHLTLRDDHQLRSAVPHRYSIAGVGSAAAFKYTTRTTAPLPHHTRRRRSPLDHLPGFCLAVGVAGVLVAHGSRILISAQAASTE
jgi:hypothetical protein